MLAFEVIWEVFWESTAAEAITVAFAMLPGAGNGSSTTSRAGCTGTRAPLVLDEVAQEVRELENELFRSGDASENQR